MPIFRLTKELVFPDPELADEDGVLAVGGDLSVERLILAYSMGIFPWFSKEDPIIWWSPNPRFVLFPQNIKISRSMKKFLKKGLYSVTYDTAFREVISMCGKTRKETWITEAMIRSYLRLHEYGIAHSVETWHEGKLVGGLYGISLGRCFFGESMFSVMDNASKTALIRLVEDLVRLKFIMIDCQVHTKHLESLGAVQIERKLFKEYLTKGISYDTIKGKWNVNTMKFPL